MKIDGRAATNSSDNGSADRSAAAGETLSLGQSHDAVRQALDQMADMKTLQTI